MAASSAEMFSPSSPCMMPMQDTHPKCHTGSGWHWRVAGRRLTVWLWRWHKTHFWGLFSQNLSVGLCGRPAGQGGHKCDRAKLQRTRVTQGRTQLPLGSPRCMRGGHLCLLVPTTGHSYGLGLLQGTGGCLQLVQGFYPHPFSGVCFPSRRFSVFRQDFAAKHVGILSENPQQSSTLSCKHSDILRSFHCSQFLETKHFTSFSALLLAHCFACQCCHISRQIKSFQRVGTLYGAWNLIFTQFSTCSL